SQGIMLESTSERLCRQGGVHHGSPDKRPAVRLQTMSLAGELKVPFTTGILIGIGETRDERVDALEAIADLHAAHGHSQGAVGPRLVNRLPVYPAFVHAADTWLAPDLATRVRRMSDAEGFARDDDWAPGNTKPPPTPLVLARGVDAEVAKIVERATSGERLASNDIVRLFAARDTDYRYVTQAADALRRAISGDVVRYVVNRNINYTNICYFRCKFCAFSKGRTHEDLRGSPYDLAIEEITRRSIEAWDRGATEVCLQGGIHPDYTGATYEAICRAIKAVVPKMHIHAFSALEVTQGAATLGL